MNDRARQGFTLAEMAIVLVVIALIIGGVLAGRNLLRSSQVNSILSDAELYKNAARGFRAKYEQLPGDFANAEAMWNSDAGCPTTTANNTKKLATCNGNGDGQIRYDGTHPHEWLRAWQHLANAGMIPGAYSGAYNTVTATTAGINMPASKVPGAYFAFYYQGVVSGGTWFSGNFGNLLGFTDSNTTGMLSPEEARSLDIKADDGLPGMGLIYGGLSPSCVTSYAATATYNLTSTGTGCTLAFKPGF